MAGRALLSSPRHGHGLDAPRGRPRPWAGVPLALALAGALVAQPGQQQPTTPLLRTEGDHYVLSFNEREGLPVRDFIKMAEQVTGRNFIYNETEISQGDPNANKINFIGTKRILKEEFFAFFQTLLYVKNLACVVRGKGNTEIIEIINLNGPKRTEATSGAAYVQPEKLADYAAQTGVNIMTAVPVEHVRATMAAQTLRPFFAGSGGTQLNIGTAGNERVILLQGFAPQVVNAYELIKLVDQPDRAPDQEFKVMQLEHHSAEELVPLLEQILSDRGRPGGAAEGAGGGVIPGQQTQIKILAHTALNAVILSGTREQVLEAMSLIVKMDQPVEQAQEDTHVVHVRNVEAKALRDTLSQFLQEDQTAQQAAQAGQTQVAGQRRPRRTVVYAHEPSNSLLISGTATAVDSVKRVIDKLDTRQPQVLIEAAVVELSTTDAIRFGIELAGLDIANDNFRRPFGVTSFGLSTFTDTDGNGLPDTRLPDFENPLRGVTGGIIASDDFAIPVLLNALDSDSRANILSLPSVVVNNNVTATVSNKEVRPTQQVNQGTATTSTGAGADKEAGIELSISPSISSNNYLRLNVTLTVSRFTTAFDPTAVTAGVQVQRKIQTAVTIPSGSTMVLGGVIQDTQSESDDGVPFLKDIPILGWLFRSYSKANDKTNLYFFLTPNILDETDFSDLSEISFRRKMEAAQYIGHRRMQIVDHKWREPTLAQRLEDSGTTIDDIDQYGGFEIPVYQRTPQGTSQQPPLPPRERDSLVGPRQR
ncbi:MAG: secretin N-terminal domain-containing protein [Planctomycetota bacterium]